MVNFRALLAEFIGTFALIFVGVLVIHHLGQAEAGLIGIAFAHGLAIACLASATGAISGGHLNPAVSFGFFLGKKMTLPAMLGYWVAQCLGAVVAAICASMVVVGDGMMVVGNGVPAPMRNLSMGAAILAEAIATFFLMFVIMGTAVDKRAPKVGGIYVGLAVTMGIYAIGPMTGAALNPARWFGPALITGKLQDAVIYIVGPMIGAAVASLVYTMALEQETLKPSHGPEARVIAE
jgi:MIP family channel proteins